MVKCFGNIFEKKQLLNFGIEKMLYFCVFLLMLDFKICTGG